MATHSSVLRPSLVAQRVKNLVCNVGDLGWEDPLEKRKATHSSILAWRIPRTEDPSGATVCRVTKSWT